MLLLLSAARTVILTMVKILCEYTYEKRVKKKIWGISENPILMRCRVIYVLFIPLKNFLLVDRFRPLSLVTGNLRRWYYFILDENGLVAETGLTITRF